MQGLHQQQQQLAALLSAAHPSADDSDDDPSPRLAAIHSLHRAILHPHNSLLLSHSAPFLAQSLSQLLSDKSFEVRHAAVTAYGTLCAVISSIPVTSNGRQNHVMLGSLVDRFIGWALPLLSNVTAVDGTKELALEGLREFLNVGGTDRYALPILKACQVLLEDERTSLTLLHRLLSVITLISLKFFRSFQPHFPDVVDLLLGWALVPDLAQSDRHVIMDSFLQFQKHWVGSLPMSLRLLTKFLGDMEALLHDGTPGTQPQFHRLLALLGCFSTILQATASGLLEMNLLEQIIEPLGGLLPRLLRCLSMIGQKFGWSEWIEDSWKCLTLLAEILRDRFSNFYPLAVDILFQGMEFGVAGFKKITAFQVYGVLKTNLQLLSLQKLGLLPSSVGKLLQFDASVSQLRLHPNHLVTASSAATYVFLLQHGNAEVVDEAVTSLIEELELLKRVIGNSIGSDQFNCVIGSKRFSKLELFAIIKFDLKVLLACVSLVGDNSLIGQMEIAKLYLRRSKRLVSFISKEMNPFELPIQAFMELQIAVVKTLERLNSVEFLIKCSVREQNCDKAFVEFPTKKEDSDDQYSDGFSAVITEHLEKYSKLLIKAFHVSSPLAIKLVALDWGQKFCENVMAINKISSTNGLSFEACQHAGVIMKLVFSLLGGTFEREPKVRSQVAVTVEMFMQAKLLHPVCFYPLAEGILEKLGDPAIEIKDDYVRLLALILPTTVYSCGLNDSVRFRPLDLGLGNISKMHWKQLFALKQLPLQLHSQHLVSILSYISQRWKVPLSSWIQRLIHSCRSSKDAISSQPEETGGFGANSPWLDVQVDEDVLERICSVNNLAGALWAVQEAARYCIATRLRTNLGGPTQTFAALERMLLDIAHLLQLDNEQNDGNLSMIGSSGAHLLPMRLLLDFVEALKKNVYNAYEGSVILPPATRQSSLFFRANKKVCEDWFSRICEPMINAGLAVHCNDAVIQYCTLRLQEFRNLSVSTLKEKSRAQVTDNIHNIRERYREDVLKVLRHIALALCRSFEPDSLIGLQKWVSSSFFSLLGEENQSFSECGTVGPLSWISGLVYQAKGEYENAAAHFTHLLQTEESLISLGSDGIQFVIARVIESFAAVSDWKSLEAWLLELQLIRAKHAGRNYSGALTMAGNEVNAIHALARFDEGDYQAAWSSLDLTPKSNSELTLDPKIALQRSEQMLLQSLLYQKEGKGDKVLHDLHKARSMLEESLSVLPLDGLAEASPLAIQLHCIFLVEEDCKLKSTDEKSKQLQSILNSLQPGPSSISKIRQDCNPWLKVLRVYQTISPTSPVTLKFCMNLHNLARKQGNLSLANRLNNYLKDNISACSEERHHEFLALNLQYESILLQYAENNFEDAFKNLWSFLRPSMVSSTYKISDSEERILKAKACLKLSNWLRRDYSDWSPESIILKMPADFNMAESASLRKDGSEENINCKQNLVSITEEIVGTATKLSSRICPTMGKSWISYASWCFKQARDSLPVQSETSLGSCLFSPMLVQEISPERFKLTKDEVQRIKSLVLCLLQDNIDIKGFVDEMEKGSSWLDSTEHSSNANPLQTLIRQLVNIIETAAGAPGAENSGERLSAVVSSQLRICLLDTNFGLGESDIVSALDDFVDIWWSLRRRRVSLFAHAAHGYIQYLSFSSSRICHSQMLGSEYEALKQKTGSCTLRATLYIIHILLNYGLELKDTLESALSAVPLLPWQEVTPQLFARISSHPEQVIRKQLEGLLIMLAKRSPYSIVYPTLVDVNAYEEKPSEELHHVLGCLRELYPRLVQDVQLMISELGNVTVLWEELWLITLQDLHTDVMRRINVLKEEAARIAENVTLSQNEKNKINSARYSAMMAPIVVALDRRLASTSRKPETPHEAWFQEEYNEQLKSAIVSLKIPPASSAALGDVWKPFDSIAASLASYQRKSSVSLQEVAPNLALLLSSDVPMPGLEKQMKVPDSDKATDLQGVVTIASFDEQVTILSTKTKPKKLGILGLDGQKYTYLLKGREDLRLDARIMQLLQAINGFLRSSSSCSNSLSIRYYSVTPISGRAGLIQWVDNVVSIYSVFKSWQTRAQLAQFLAMGTANTKSSAPPPVPRPGDMFYGKIIPALKEKGIKRVISRRDWPHEVKCKVLLDLMKEVPRHLLYHELWCASEGYKAFNSKMKRYAGTLAAMSMVGHVFGLGDRHLDNILIDFCSGDIVHIDYNVCFDKGQRLKVPEIVPFRLTQMIEAALGVTGIEGSFRANCETVIGVLRKNKDILLMLLEVFVWDPLVEWTRGDFHDEAAIGGEERKGMELAVSLSLFASRVQEIRVPLQEHHDQLLTSLPAVESALERFADVLNQYELVSTLYCRADQERSSLILHETSAKSIVAEATSNSEKVRASFEIQAREFAQAKAMVAEKAQEAMTWAEQHGRILDALRCNLIPEINAHFKLSSMEIALSLTSAVTVAGVPLTVVPEPTQAQCHDIDREVSQLITELDDGLTSAITSLQAYSLALQRVLPLNYLSTSAVHDWAQVLRLSINALSSDILSLARRQASEIFAKFHVDSNDSIKCSHDDLCFRVEKYAIEIEKLEKECSEIESSIGPESESKTKDRLLSAFMKFMPSICLLRKEDGISSVQSRYDGTNNTRLLGEPEEEWDKVLSILSVAVSSLYNEVKHRIQNIYSDLSGGRNKYSMLQNDSGAIFAEFEEQVEKCNLVTEFVNDLSHFIGKDIPSVDFTKIHSKFSSERNWLSIFRTILISGKGLVSQMTEVVLPDVIRSAVSFNSELMDAFGLISQVRGSIETAVEQLVEVEMERASLAELEQNYFVKVGLITEQQLALEEAAVKGRDHLSWEEAEELASQEEACRAQLDQLHQTWNQRDVRTSSLIKREANIKNALVSVSCQFQSLVSVEEERELHILRSKALLAALLKPFLELESNDIMLSSADGSGLIPSSDLHTLADLTNSGNSISEYVWKVGGLLDEHSFFIWKIGVIDSFLDACIHDVASSVEQNLGFDQSLNFMKKKLEIQLQKHIGHYLKERVAPSFLACLDKENEHFKQLTETKELALDPVKKDGVVKKVLLMLEEYCNAHETARAAKSAASLMKRQVNELKEALRKTTLEVVQMEWMHDVSLNPSYNRRIKFEKYLDTDDILYSIILNFSRPKLLENIQSAASKITTSIDCLLSCERTSLIAEGQLERAMGWACGGPNSSSSGNASTKGSGIPPEFHEHIKTRRQILWESREKASDIVKLCMSVLEFEASRDGYLLIPGQPYPFRNSVDGKTWQQVYLNALTRLDVTFHSYTRTEQEWKRAQCTVEAASNGLYTATNELCIASLKAKSASGDLQSTVLSMRDCAYEASVALSAFVRVSRIHTALTSECGSMLEEVLAITEDIHDVYNLGKEAAAIHHSLMEDLSKANAILLPLESVLSKDVAAMADAIARESETKKEISHIHGQAIYQSYCLRIREACQTFKPLVPSLTSAVKGLYSLLTRLARTASLHAGNLHKALEGIGESQEIKSQDVALSRSDANGGDTVEFDDKEGEGLSRPDDDKTEDFAFSRLSLEGKGWVSPPDSICCSSSGSDITSAEVSLPDSLNDSAENEELLSQGSSSRNSSSLVHSIPLPQTDVEEISPFEVLESLPVEADLNVAVSVKLTDEASGHPKGFTLPDDKFVVPNPPNDDIDKSGVDNDLLSANKVKNDADDEHGEAPDPNIKTSTRVGRGKNAYALSVLRRVEMKIDGRDISERREISIAEQVDYLLKQATSVDNLCNMYEGWTPWI